jgi:hypothetical protein
MHGDDGHVGRSDTLEVAEPEIRIRVNGVLDEYAKGLLFGSMKCVGYSLDGYRAGRGACTQPEVIDAGRKGEAYVLGRSYLGSDREMVEQTSFGKPCEGFGTKSLESARAGTRFPRARTKYNRCCAGLLR